MGRIWEAAPSTPKNPVNLTGGHGKGYRASGRNGFKLSDSKRPLSRDFDKETDERVDALGGARTRTSGTQRMPLHRNHAPLMVPRRVNSQERWFKRTTLCPKHASGKNAECGEEEDGSS